MLLDQATKANLIRSRHPDEFDAEPVAIAPADFREFDTERCSQIREYDLHLEVGTRLHQFPAHDLAARDRHINHRAFSNV